MEEPTPYRDSDPARELAETAAKALARPCGVTIHWQPQSFPNLPRAPFLPPPDPDEPLPCVARIFCIQGNLPLTVARRFVRIAREFGVKTDQEGFFFPTKREALACAQALEAPGFDVLVDPLLLVD